MNSWPARRSQGRWQQPGAGGLGPARGGLETRCPPVPGAGRAMGRASASAMAGAGRGVLQFCVVMGFFFPPFLMTKS